MNMIEINLIPSHLRKKKKRSLMPAGMRLPLEVIVGLGGGLIMLLVVAHVILLFINVGKLANYKQLQKKMEVIRPNKERIDLIIKNMRNLKSKKNDIEELTKGKDVSWSQKLNILSDILPQGVWLKKINLGKEMFFIQGSAISRQSKEMINVHSFTASLKRKKEFFSSLGELELGSIQRRKIEKVEVADFVIKVEVK